MSLDFMFFLNPICSEFTTRHRLMYIIQITIHIDPKEESEPFFVHTMPALAWATLAAASKQCKIKLRHHFFFKFNFYAKISILLGIDISSNGKVPYTNNNITSFMKQENGKTSLSILFFLLRLLSYFPSRKMRNA